MDNVKKAIPADQVVEIGLAAGDLRSIYSVLAHMKNDYHTPWVDEVMKQLSDSGIWDHLSEQKKGFDAISFRDSACL
jgi:hypothetical protein